VAELRERQVRWGCFVLPRPGNAAELPGANRKKGAIMREFRFLALAGLAALLLVANAHPAAAQTTTTNSTIGVFGTLPAGIIVSPDGVLRVKEATDKTGQLTRTRIAEAKARLGANLAKISPLRKISLNRLAAAIAEKSAAGQDLTDEMKYLAGLTRLQYVFYYPDSKDIVIAGPAEGFFMDPSGRVLGMNSGRAVVELQDLATALRAYPPEGKAAHVLSVSIDPTPEGLAQMQQWLASIAGRVQPGDAPAIVAGLKEKLGMHQVSVQGISSRTHFAQVMVEADYRMKLIGIGIEPPPVKMATYIDRASPTDVSRNALQRWFFTPNYECVRVAEDDYAMELVGQGVKLIGESELVQGDGARVAGRGQSKASQVYCDSFTANYPQIAARHPVYAQLKNLIDLAIAAAFIQKHDYYGQAGWKLETIGDERKLPIETYEAPKQVETACTAVWKGTRLMTPVGGGVQMDPRQALETSRLLKDEKGAVKQARAEVKLDGLAKGQWWWD
jgi:Protein of unknown function (DUF1598)